MGECETCGGSGWTMYPSIKTQGLVRVPCGDCDGPSLYQGDPECEFCLVLLKDHTPQEMASCLEDLRSVERVEFPHTPEPKVWGAFHPDRGAF